MAKSKKNPKGAIPTNAAGTIMQTRKAATKAATAGKYGSPMSMNRTGVSIYQKGSK